MDSEDDKTHENSLLDHVEFIEEHITENSQNHDSADKLSLIDGNQQ